MAAPYIENARVTQAVRWIRRYAHEPSTSSTYTNNQLMDMLFESLDAVTQELYAMADSIPIARFDVTTVAGQAAYMLPPNIKQVHRIAHMSSTSGLVEWEYKPRSKYNPIGPGYIIEGNRTLRLIPWPVVDGDVVTIEYVPGGYMPMHQNVAPIYSGAGDTGTKLLTTSSWRLNPSETTGYFIGAYDKRPNSFIGCTLRILGAATGATPGGLVYFPVFERTILTYDYTTGAVTWEPALETDPTLSATSTIDGVTRTYLNYEIVHDVDQGLLNLAALDTAAQICAIQGRSQQLALLQSRIVQYKRTLQLRMANQDARLGKGWDTDTFDNPGRYDQIWGD